MNMMPFLAGLGEDADAFQLAEALYGPKGPRRHQEVMLRLGRRSHDL